MNHMPLITPVNAIQTDSADGRRRLLKKGGLAVGLLAVVSLSGCGWRIRGAGYNFGFKRIMVLAPGQGPVVDRSLSEEERTKMGGEMAQVISGNGLAERLRRELKTRYRLQLVARIAQAEVVCRVLQINQQRLVVGFSGSGRPREIELRTSVTLRVEDPLGRSLIATDTIDLRRAISVSESEVLSTDDAEKFQINAMEEDILQQILRRLATISTYADPARSEKA
jgi:LPS-assembly lipoprotein